jgi:hypothetical protein
MNTDKRAQEKEEEKEQQEGTSRKKRLPLFFRFGSLFYPCLSV